MSSLLSLEDILSQRASRKAAWMAAEATKRVTVAIEGVYPPGSKEREAFDAKAYQGRLHEEFREEILAQAMCRVADSAIGEVA